MVMIEKDYDSARIKHLAHMKEVKDLLNELNPNTPHYRDLKRHYLKLKKQLYVYDNKMYGRGRK